MRRMSSLLLGVSLAAGALLSCLGSQPGQPALRVETLSTPADLVSGGNALVKISADDGVPAGSVRVNLNGTDVSAAFKPAPIDALGRDPRALIGLVESLPVGESTLQVVSGGRGASLKIVNHPLTGPVFSGPHQQPFLCQTEQNGLGAPVDASCSASTQVTYVYKSTEPVAPPTGPGTPGAQDNAATMATRLPAGFKPFDPNAPRPSDLAQVTTSVGLLQDYIVRRERGTINRSVYEIAMLHTPGEPLPTPWTSSPGWNGRLVFVFGGGCGSGYRQGTLAPALSDNALSAGYAVAVASLSVFGTSCNDVTSAETAMMVKEHFVEQLGMPVHTIGAGGSGGAMQQHLIAQNYPGLLDGITPVVSYPDALSVLASSADCSLLVNALSGAKQEYTDEQKRAIAGTPTWRLCQVWAASNLQRPTNCNASIKDLAYDATKNPKGARCGMHDNMANLIGRDPASGLARRHLDNVGVQYGLVAFDAGKITAEQFVEVNERVGGHDVDGNFVSQRTVADPEALRNVYARGRINSGAGSLGSIPIIDVRPYLDPLSDIHDSYRSFVTRARIAAANGGRADNQVIVRLHQPDPGQPRPEPPFVSIRLMDQWLTALAKDTSSDPRSVKLVRAKPAELVDSCYTKSGEKIVEPAVYGGPGRCNELYPPAGDARIAAGGPLADDVLKCRLKPLRAEDYGNALTPEQLARLKAVFPDGVCDYSKPGVEQVRAKGGWQRY